LIMFRWMLLWHATLEIPNSHSERLRDILKSLTVYRILLTWMYEAPDIQFLIMKSLSYQMSPHVICNMNSVRSFRFFMKKEYPDIYAKAIEVVLSFV
jgi:hypothetical protein